MFADQECAPGSNLSESLWTWATEQGIAFFDLFERVRFRVEAELWRDVAPQGPEGPSLEMAVNGMRSLGPASDDDSMAEASQGPYSIIVCLHSATLSSSPPTI